MRPTNTAGSLPVRRQVRAIFGFDDAIDAVDRAIAQAARSRDGWPPAIRLGLDQAPLEKGWGIESDELVVWLPRDRTVDLRHQHLLWRLLEVLYEGGGRATKEELLVRAWDVAEYHPLRHDNRLQVAMRKLRRAIEDDASRPERVLTTPDGYALGGVAFRR